MRLARVLALLLLVLVPAAHADEVIISPSPATRLNFTGTVLPLGAAPNDTQCLKDSAGTIVGGTCGAAGGSVMYVTQSCTINCTVTAAARTLVLCDATAAPVTVTLLAATATGNEVLAGKIDATVNACTLSRAGADTIDGGTTVTLAVQYEKVHVIDGASAKWSQGLSKLQDGFLNDAYSGVGVCAANTFASTLTRDAAPTCTQPAFSNLTGSATCAQEPALTGDVTTSAGSCTTALGNIPNDTTSAGDIIFTNIAAPVGPSVGKDVIFTDSTDLRLHDKNNAGAIGTTVVANTGAANNFLTAVSTAGVISRAQPAFSNLSGSATCGQEPALTGDVTSSAGSCATVLGNIPTATTAAGTVVWTNIAAPSSPSAGKDSTFTDSTDLRLHDKNASGVIGTTVVADTGAANNFLTAVSTAGAISKAQPSVANLSGLPVTVGQGGTGDVTLTNHGVMLGQTTANVVVTAAGASGSVLTGQGASADPSFSITPTLGVGGTSTGTLTLSNATGAGTYTLGNPANTTTYTETVKAAVPAQGDLLDYSNGTGQRSSLVDVATGSVVVSGGVGAVPTYSSSPTLGGTLTVQGATVTVGVPTTTSGSLVLSNATGSGTYTLSQVASTTTYTETTKAVVPAQGDLLTYSNGTGQRSSVVDVATGSVLISGGVGAVPTYGIVPAAAMPTSAIGFDFIGTPGASQIEAHACAFTFNFPANFTTPTSQASCGTNPAETDAYTVKVATVTIGTVSLSTSCVATLTTVGGATKTCTAGQRLEIDAPATVSGTDVAITLAFTRS